MQETVSLSSLPSNGKTGDQILLIEANTRSRKWHKQYKYREFAQLLAKLSFVLPSCLLARSLAYIDHPEVVFD